MLNMVHTQGRWFTLPVFLLLFAGGLWPGPAFAASNEACEVEDAGAGPAGVWLLCEDHRLLLSPDEGKSWQARSIPTESRLKSAAFVDARRGFVVGYAGTLFATEDGGNAWRKVDLPIQDNLTDIDFKGESGWIVGYGGAVLHTDDGGRTWAQQKSGVTQPLECLFFLDAKNGWAGGWIGNITRTTDGGHTWTPGKVPTMAWTVNAIYFKDPVNGWAVGFAGQILRTKDGGVTWTSASSPTTFSLTSILFDGSGTGWIAADNDLLVSKDGGEKWVLLDVEGRPFLNRILRVGNSLWAVGQYNLLQLAPGSQEWKAVGLPVVAAPGSPGPAKPPAAPGSR
jgi:photosystem II stability/assembly factor-like uncharacterized protein